MKEAPPVTKTFFRFQSILYFSSVLREEATTVLFGLGRVSVIGKNGMRKIPSTQRRSPKRTRKSGRRMEYQLLKGTILVFFFISWW